VCLSFDIVCPETPVFVPSNGYILGRGAINSTFLPPWENAASSLSFTVSKFKDRRSPFLATQCCCPFGNHGRNPRATLPPKGFEYPTLFVKNQVVKPQLCENSPSELARVARAQWSVVGILQLSCRCMPKPLCKGFGGHLKGCHLVERAQPFVVCSPKNRVRPLWRWFAFVAPHPSNVDVLSLTRKELRES
jgi:hypothetical protein